MMASDGLQYEIKYIDEPMDSKYKQPNDNIALTSSSSLSSTIISVIATT